MSDFPRLLNLARKTASPIEVENEGGLASLPQEVVADHLRTALLSIDAAAVAKDWSGVAEAYAMIERAVERLTDGTNLV